MKIAWVFILNLFIFINTSQGQDSLNDKSLTVKYLIKRGYFFRDSAGYASIPSNQKKWPDKLYYNTVYTSKFLGSPTVPFNFTKIEYVDGEFLVSPTLSLGYGYTWFTGDFIFNEYDKIIVNPGVFFGAVGNVGLQSNFSFSRLGNFFLGGFIGIGS
ncbi:MAG TPA: hypothetical protein VK590_11015, partial [Saprospiraceae bacterium]|nr:hypothetical protein [Saprospiraceae bacterium]